MWAPKCMGIWAAGGGGRNEGMEEPFYLPHSCPCHNISIQWGSVCDRCPRKWSRASLGAFCYLLLLSPRDSWWGLGCVCCCGGRGWVREKKGEKGGSRFRIFSLQHLPGHLHFSLVFSSLLLLFLSSRLSSFSLFLFLFFFSHVLSFSPRSSSPSAVT